MAPSIWYATMGSYHSIPAISSHACNTIDGKDYITTNLRVLAENKAMDDLKYLSNYEEGKHELRITVHFTTQISITREYNRHRANSMAEQSTRYCNYSKNKFDNEITINLPTWVEAEGFDGSQDRSDYRIEDMCADIAEGRAAEWSKLDNLDFRQSGCRICLHETDRGRLQTTGSTCHPAIGLQHRTGSYRFHE